MLKIRNTRPEFERVFLISYQWDSYSFHDTVVFET